MKQFKDKLILLKIRVVQSGTQNKIRPNIMPNNVKEQREERKIEPVVSSNFLRRQQQIKKLYEGVRTKVFLEIHFVLGNTPVSVFLNIRSFYMIYVHKMTLVNENILINTILSLIYIMVTSKFNKDGKMIYESYVFKQSIRNYIY
jgi:hypothetical protein